MSDHVFPCKVYKGRQDELCLTCGWGHYYHPTECLSGVVAGMAQPPPPTPTPPTLRVLDGGPTPS